ncbi:diamine N-acetyltransferase [Chytriomyces sp. MP71]|nr:diamine N-acetyltransferase [Chytriomyces sp. MP71]
MPVNVRKADQNDVPTIHSFIRQLAVYEKLEHEHVGTEDDLRATLFGETTFAHVFIASDETGDLGFALYFFNYSTFLSKPGIYLEDLFVVPEARGKGVGKALLKHLAKTAVEMGCGRVSWSALKWNTSATDFYEKAVGARRMDGWVGFRLQGESLTKFASS